MLSSLRIKNLALVADLSLDLQPGLNVITGETGAGKSILIGALNLVLGERADRTLLRSGADQCTVEAVFDVRKLRGGLDNFLDENGLEACEEGQLVLRRSFTSAGTNRQFINGSPASLQTLARLGEWLVDIHGPHDHQSLLQAPRQLAILDAFAGLGQARQALVNLVRQRTALESEIATLIVDEKTYAQQLDLFRFQAREISEARLNPDEERALEQEYQRTSQAARLLELTQGAQDLLSDDDSGLLTRAGALGRLLRDLQRVDSSAASLVACHDQATEAWRELQAELHRYVEQVEIDPTRLQQLEERLNLLHSLKRKYGSSVAEVLAFGQEVHLRLQSLEQRDEELSRLNAARTALQTELAAAANDLSARRRKIIPALNKAVVAQLRALGFKQSHFEVALATGAGPPSASGIDTVDFQFAPNPGEPPRPLRAIASSGEIARVMLALKTVLASEDEIPVLVFDEVDANVGGETANAVGEKMKQIARQRQVLCITHLAPVAAQADAHYVVEKQFRTGRTISQIRLLEQEERVDELARMLGGATAAARKHAEALLA